MFIRTFASGSGGNCALVGGGGGYILLDAGISLKKIKNALAAMDLRLEDISAVLLTHEHSDHICAVPMLEKYTDIPIYTSGGTARGILAKGRASGKNFCIIEENEFNIGGVKVTPFETPHDAAESFCYAFEAEGKKIAAVHDLGHITAKVMGAVSGADAVLLESNHDVNMLRAGAYPYQLKVRILGERGHLSNDAAAEAALSLVKSGTRQIMLAHLSRENNTPKTAYNAVCEKLLNGGVHPGEMSLFVAAAEEMSRILEI